MAHAETRGFARAPNFFLCVSDFNQDAREFYQRLGYREIGSIPDLIIAGHSEILMRKTQGPARETA
jgi:ribosomal protein S18 acetylase RimI-like enzyme